MIRKPILIKLHRLGTILTKSPFICLSSCHSPVYRLSTLPSLSASETGRQEPNEHMNISPRTPMLMWKSELLLAGLFLGWKGVLVLASMSKIRMLSVGHGWAVEHTDVEVGGCGRHACEAALPHTRMLKWKGVFMGVRQNGGSVEVRSTPRFPRAASCRCRVALFLPSSCAALELYNSADLRRADLGGHILSDPPSPGRHMLPRLVRNPGCGALTVGHPSYSDHWLEA